MVPLPLLDSPGGAVNWPTINGMVGAARTHAPADMVAGMKDRLKSESVSVVTNTLTVRPLRQRCRPAARCCSADAPSASAATNATPRAVAAASFTRHCTLSH
jgi:hypothetical protein